MNYRTVFHMVGNILIIEGGIMVIPLLVALFYREMNALTGFVTAILLAFSVGFLLTRIDRKNEIPLSRDSMVIVALSWIAISFFGAFPFYISGEIPVFIKAYFETMSGFTTTGITVFDDLETVSKSLLFWRSFTVWLGGMGVLVFMMAVLPRKGSGSTVHLVKAESSGPQNDKIVPKTQKSAIILYLIYAGLSVLDFLFLKAGGMNWFDAVLTMFGTAGTGGFNIHDQSIAYYQSDYVTIVTTVFMFLFGVSYALFYLVLTGRALSAFRNVELRTYTVITVSASIAIAIDLSARSGNFLRELVNSAFAVTAMSSSTGYILENYDAWPGFSRTLLLFLMFFGACSGSTACGIKISRIIILAKSVWADVKRLLSPHSVNIISYNGKTLRRETITGVHSFVAMYAAVYIVSVILVSVDDLDMITNLSAVAAAINNVGCGFSLVGPEGSFSVFSRFSMIVLSFDMLAGRLEIFPMLMLFYPRTWSRY